jgi:hypothetical protein
MDKLFWVVTVACFVLILGPAAYYQKFASGAYVALILMLIAGWFRPVAMEVGAEGLRILYPMRWRTIPRGKIVRAWRVDYKALSPMIRIGVGGFLGIFGMFYRPGKGWVDVNVTSTRDLVLLERSGGHPLLLSPQNPAAFLQSLGMAEEPGRFV